tara:strand:+ start:338 stop:1432 length:1095 start_codon:yes stop_codon:yes gene_type:complete
MKVKFTDLYKLIFKKKEIFSKTKYLIKNSKFSGGDEVLKFEKNFKKFTGSKFCVSVGNGTDALEIAIKSLNLKKNSEIIVPVNTWIATAEAVVSNGYKVKFCDVNLNDYSICLKDLKNKITKKTSAIIAVHLYGIATNILEIKKIIKKKNIKIIEDCAQAHGTRLNKSHVGKLGDVGTFSFFPGKNLGAFGDGGAIVTNSKKIYNYCLRSRNHGALKKYDHKFSGRNSRLDTIQAAILRIKLKDYNKVLKVRNEYARIYFKLLSNIKNLTLLHLNNKNTHCFHQFVIRTNKRNELMKYLKKNKIQTMIHYPYMLNELKFFKSKEKLKNSYLLGKKILSLPISEDHTKKQILYVANKIKKFYLKY